MMFHPKHVLIKDEFQKHRMDHQSDIIIIIITIIMLFDSLQLSGVLLGNVYCVSATPRSLETQHFPQQVSSSKDGR